MSPKSYNRVLTAALQPWAIKREMVTTIALILSRHLRGDARAGDITVVEPRPEATPTTTGGVGILPIHGAIAPRMNLFSDFSGGTSYEEATSQLRDLIASKDVGTIVLDIDSPGGSVAGATEFAREVLRARTFKPIIAQAHYEMASAAYWIGACATEIVAAPSALVGSIGVYTIHEDLSKALEQDGIRVTFISAGKYKVDGNDTEPLSESARARMKALVDTNYARFVGDVAKGRGVSEASVRGGYGEGACVDADEALALGMIDRIATLEETVTRLMSGAPGLTPRAHATHLPAPPTPPQEPPPKATGSATRIAEQREAERAFLSLGF
jgi:signal peptide peptidase SppA